MHCFVLFVQKLLLIFKILSCCWNIFCTATNQHRRTVIAGVNGDAITLANKGPTVLKERDRYESVRNCKWCDEVVEDAPWIITTEFLDKHQIDYSIHDPEPYPSADKKIADVYGPLKEADRFLASKRTDGISTTDIIVAIIKDYDTYVLRNYKRGVSFRDMNVPWYKRLSIRYRVYAEQHPRLAPTLALGTVGLFTTAVVAFVKPTLITDLIPQK